VRRTRRAAIAWVTLSAALSAGCSTQHGEYGSGAYVMGAIFLLIGLAAGVGILLGRK
jgi:hypothetical protein